MRSIPCSICIGLVGVLLAALLTCCVGQAPEPTDVSVNCPDYNCTLTWNVPENVTSSDDIVYIVEYEELEGDNSTYSEVPNCVDIRHTECNLVPVVSINTLANIHFVAVWAVVNGNLSYPVEVSFIPNVKASLEHPVVVLLEPVEPTSFTVHIYAPISPYANPNTGELYRTDELPPFQKGKLLKAKFRHSSTLYMVEPNNELEEIKEENGPTLDQVIVFSDLTPYTTYRLEVWSWLSFRLVKFRPSKEPSVILVTTPEDVPSQPPTLTSIVRKSPNCSSPDFSPVVVSWKPPPREHQNGLLTHYSIRYMYPGFNFSEAAVKNCSASDSFLVVELLRWQAYEFAVLACNSIGCAESIHKTLFNLQAIRKGSQCSNISINLTDDHPLVISWQPPRNLTECIMKYVVTIIPDDDELEDGRKKPTITEVAFNTTTLEINETLRPGKYVAAVRSFVRSGIDSDTPGEEARKEFMIENKTVTDHLVLPLVITFSFVFSAVMVAIVICAKWILRPFDFQLEKTRALKVARAYQLEPTHYREQEHEVYDPIPSRRSSRTSTSSRPSQTTIPRGILRSDSSSVGNRLAYHQNGEGPRSLPSHTEDPCEEDALLEGGAYSPVAARRTGQLERVSHGSEPSVREPLICDSSRSGGRSNQRFPMLTIEVPTDNSSPRVVRWKARGFNPVYDEDEDPFDLPKAEDFDGSDIPTGSGFSASPNVYSPTNSKKGFPSVSTSSSVSEPRQRLNYASLVSQTSETSESGLTPPVINVLQPSLFMAVDEEPSDNESNDDSQRTQYAQMASSANTSNLSPSIPAPSAGEGGYIDPYSQIGNSESNEPRSLPDDSRQNRAGTDASDEYMQLARADHQLSPEVREVRTNSNASESYVQLSNCNSPSPMLPRKGLSESGDTNADSNGLRSSPAPQRVGGGNESEPYGVTNSPSLRRENDSVSELGAISAHSYPSGASPQHNQRPETGGGDLAGPYMQLLPSEINTGLRVSPVPVRRENGTGSSDPYMQLKPSGSRSPTRSPIPMRDRTREHNLSGTEHLYRSVRVPAVHAVGSPLLPSRALDIRDSDTSDTDSQYSQTNHDHENSDIAGASQVTNGANGSHDGPTEQSCPNNAAENFSKCQNESTAVDNDVQEMNGRELPKRNNIETSGYVAPSDLMSGAAFVNGDYTSQS